MFRRNKEINLSSSVVSAIELLRKALEIRYGAELTFGGPMVVNPGRVDKGGDIETRVVCIDTEFIECPPPKSSAWKEVGAVIDLRKDSEGAWTLHRADMRVTDPNDPSKRHGGSWLYHVRYDYEHSSGSCLFICDDQKGTKNADGFMNPTVWRGHGLHDRRVGVLFPHMEV